MDNRSKGFVVPYGVHHFRACSCMSVCYVIPMLSNKVLDRLLTFKPSPYSSPPKWSNGLFSFYSVCRLMVCGFRVFNYRNCLYRSPCPRLVGHEFLKPLALSSGTGPRRCYSWHLQHYTLPPLHLRLVHLGFQGQSRKGMAH